MTADMVDPILLASAIAAAFVTVLSSLGGMVVLIINANSAAKDRREAAAERKAVFDETHRATGISESNGRKADTIIESTTKIHELTNSTNSNLQKALELMTEKNVGLEKLMEQMREEKRQTAAMRVVTDQQAAVNLSTPPPPASALAVKVVNAPDAPVPVQTKGEGSP